MYNTPSLPIRLGVLVVISFTFFQTASFAQSSQQYSLPLVSKGEMPEIFRLSSSEKASAQIQSDTAQGNNTAQSRGRFYVETNFVLDNLLSSGAVLYQDEVSIYLADLVDIILIDDPELRSHLQIFTVLSAYPNAFSTQRGSIFVNIGLIARLENEAQLVYVLCHEIAHYINSHSLQRYLDFESSPWTENGSSSRDQEAKLIYQNNFSQGQELEADRIGYELFLKTPYSTEHLPQVFDILKRAQEPLLYPTYFRDVDWLASEFFPASDLKEILVPTPVPLSEANALNDSLSRNLEDEARANPIAEYYRKESQTVVASSDSDTENEIETSQAGKYRSHPSPQERKKLVEEWILETPENTSLVSSETREEDFLRIRTISRLESTRSFLSYSQYLDALLQAKGLLEAGETDEYLHEIIGKSITGLAVRKLGARYYRPAIFQQIARNKSSKIEWLKKLGDMEDEELGLLAAGYLLKQWNRDSLAHSWIPPYLLTICEGLEWLVHESKDTTWSDVSRLSLEQLQNQALFNQQFLKAESRNNIKREIKEYLDTEQGKEDYESWVSEGIENGFELGLDSILLISPSYVRVDIKNRYKSRVEWVESELIELSMLTDIEAIMNDQNIHGILIAPGHYPGNDPTESFNDMALIQNWIREIDQAKGSLFIPSMQEEVILLQEKYGVKKVVKFGAFSAKKGIEATDGIMALLGLITSPLFNVTIIPGISRLFGKREASVIYMAVYDLESGRISFSTSNFLHFKLNELTIGHMLEYYFIQLSQE